jgi:hypothetical protein
MMMAAVRLVIAALMLVVVLPTGAPADEFKVIPSLALSEGYNDNILYETSNEISSWVTTVSPALTLTNRTEKVDLMLSGLVDIVRYHEESDYNSENQYYKGRLGYTFSPKGSVQAEGGWSRDYQPDRDIYRTGIALNNTQRDRTYAGLTGNYVLTERLSAGASYFFEKDNYDAPDVSDLTGNQFSLGLYHALGLATKGRFNVGYASYRFTAQDTNSAWGTVGVEHRYHELWTVIVDVGGRFARTKYQAQELQFVPPFFLVPVTVDKTSEIWGGLGKASLNYAGEKTTFSLSASYDLAPASGLSGAAQRTSFVFDIRHRLTYEFSAALSTGYFLNYAAAGDYGTGSINEATIFAVPSLRYEFTKDMYLEMLYNYTTTDYKDSNTSAQRNLVFVRFYIQYPLFE